MKTEEEIRKVFNEIKNSEVIVDKRFWLTELSDEGAGWKSCLTWILGDKE